MELDKQIVLSAVESNIQEEILLGIKESMNYCPV